MDLNYNLKMTLPKIPDIELVAIEGLERMGHFLGITDDKIGEARIVVNEAIINGFEHSGMQTPIVNIEFAMTKERLTILVTDYGKGFNPDEVESPEISEKISSKNKRGWGIKLMKSLSDDLTIESSPTGTKITIIKNLT
jgi:anti-sigma regulatory factor (Ser/Thr protein kinase)